MDLFFGRFHPLLVHLPIGFLLIAFLMEVLARYRKLPESIDRAITVTYLASFLGAAGAALSGWFLSENGAYSPEVLSVHKWMGISVMILSLILFVLRWKKPFRNPVVPFGLSVLVVILVSVTGHYGGSLTHGDDYLYEYAPGWVRTVAGYEDTGVDLSALSPDSVLIYPHMVRPILESKCVRCHADGNMAGGFNAAYYSTLFEEGDDGIPVSPGSLTGSELFRRITLPTSSRKFMPPNGHPLSFTELQILRYWIEQGADSLQRFEYTTMTPELVALMKRDYEMDLSPRPFYEKIAADSLSADALKALEEAGFRAAFLAEGNYYLDVKFSGDTLASLEGLQDTRENVLFLDLSGVVLSGNAYAELSGLTYLNRLNLGGAILPEGLLDNVVQLEYLEALNVYNTNVSAEDLEAALTAPGLKRVYLWQTGIPDSIVDGWRTQYPHLQFDSGSGLQVVKADSSAAQ